MHSETGISISARKSISFLAINETSWRLPNFQPYEYSPHCILNLRTCTPTTHQLADFIITCICFDLSAMKIFEAGSPFA
jgi:hypothetical protein